jgi:hypothetical protein
MTVPFTTNNPDAVLQPVISAIVSIGQVLTTDNNAQWANQPATAITTDYQINSRLEYPKHVLMLPVASPNGFKGKSVVFVQTAAPTLKWVVDWTACQTGVQPLVPDPFATTDNKWVLLSIHVEPAVIAAMADGATPIYRISGTYVYGHKNPSNNPFNHARFGRPPYLNNTFSRGVPLSTLTRQLQD